jgi:hypothetical protein
MKFKNIFKGVKIKQVFKAGDVLIKKHSPEILIGVGIAAGITAGISAVMATPKALTLIEEEKRDRRKEAMKNSIDGMVYEPEPITKLDMVELTWKTYLPSVALAALSVVSIISSNRISSRRTAALAAAYSLSETAFSEYKDKVAETIGEKKAGIIEEKVAQDQIKKIPMLPDEIEETGHGEFLFLDPKSGRYFRSSKEFIDRVMVKLNSQLMNEMWVPLNDLYDELGIRTTELGRDLGWNIDDGIVNMSISYISDDDGNPCGVLNYMLRTRTDYRIMM